MEEEEEEELSAADRKQLAEAQKLLYADWSTRDTLLDDYKVEPTIYKQVPFVLAYSLFHIEEIYL